MNHNAESPRRAVGNPGKEKGKILSVHGTAVTVERKAIRNLYLRVKPPDGHVVITCPARTTDREVEAFVRSHLDWIAAQRAQLQARPDMQAHTYDTGDRLPVWGAQWTLEVRTIPGSHAFVTAGDGRLLLQIGPSTPEQREAVIEEWYRRELKRVLPAVLERCRKRTGLTVDAWRVRKMSSRWGSCIPSKKQITLNSNLVKYPPQCLEMVVYHELTHLLESGHGPRFYQLLEGFCPDWRAADALLKGK